MHLATRLQPPCNLMRSIKGHAFGITFLRDSPRERKNLFKKKKKRNCCVYHFHCVQSVRIWSCSGPYFPVFGVNTERYSVSLLVQSECGEMRTRITPNTDTFYAVLRANKNKIITVTLDLIEVTEKRSCKLENVTLIDDDEVV